MSWVGISGGHIEHGLGPDVPIRVLWQVTKSCWASASSSRHGKTSSTSLTGLWQGPNQTTGVWKLWQPGPRQGARHHNKAPANTDVTSADIDATVWLLHNKTRHGKCSVKKKKPEQLKNHPLSAQCQNGTKTWKGQGLEEVQKRVKLLNQGLRAIKWWNRDSSLSSPTPQPHSLCYWCLRDN